QGAADTDRLLEVIGSTAQLQFREVLEEIAPGSENYDTTEVTVADPEDLEAYRALTDQEIVLEKELELGGGEKQVVKLRLGPTRLTGDIIESADALADTDYGGFKIVFELTEEATWSFADLTTELQGKNLAIVVDYTVESFPLVNMPIIEGKGEITGDFTREEARDLALLLKLGALPVEFEPQPQVEVY
ncbi:MAG: hypothetical protein NUV35_00070, partial [Syntrophomonadaceae bacterium]|nr:hypothetical protein [Syntrophomonadaceae bacterium]